MNSIRIGTTLLLAFMAGIAGCDSFVEQIELEGEIRHLQRRREELQAQIDNITGGSDHLTEEQKSKAGPLYIEQRRADAEIAADQARLNQLD